MGDVQYRGGCSVPRGIFKINVDDILSPVGDIMIHRGGIINTVGVFSPPHFSCSVPSEIS